MVATNANIPAVDFVLAFLWVAYAAVAFTAFNTHKQEFRIATVVLFVVSVVIAAGAGL